MRSAYIEEATLSEAWLATVKATFSSEDRRLFHTVTRIEKPDAEDPRIRSGVDNLLAAWPKPSVETVAGTIFPMRLAETSTNHKLLSERYLAMYPRLKRFPGNSRGTYFGRIIQYPGSRGPINQLDKLVRTLRNELISAGPMSARYEIALEADEMAAGSTGIYSPEKDNSSRGFPCLSHCSFQVEGDKLHLLAQYRYEYLVEKGYGNYLGLARLLAYVAGEVGLAPGEMTVVTARCKIDSNLTLLKIHLPEVLQVRR